MKFSTVFFPLLALGYASGMLSMESEPVFYLRNKSKGSIQIALKQGSGKFGKLIDIAKDGEHTQTLNTSVKTDLELYYCPTSGFCKKNLPEKFLASFPANTKIYIKFTGTTILPQTGKNDKTQQHGYSLAGNVKKVSVYREQ